LKEGDCVLVLTVVVVAPPYPATAQPAPETPLGIYNVWIGVSK